MRILIAGLGNPGEKFRHTRHNAGFTAIDAIAAKLRITNYELRINFAAEIAEELFNGKKIILAKPQTFMNESGEAIKKIGVYYKISADNIIIIHDDLDIALGNYKVVRNRSSAGHKGVQSIINALGTKDFARVRIGIGVEDKKIPTEAFVLEKFTEEEQKIINEVIEKVCSEIEILIKK